MHVANLSAFCKHLGQGFSNIFNYLLLNVLTQTRLTAITLDVWRRDSSVNEILLHTDDTHRGADKHKAEYMGVLL